MENVGNPENNFPCKRPLKKELSFDDKVTEIRVSSSGSRIGESSDETSRGLRWYNPSEKSLFANFCKSTSIHGLQYLGRNGFHFAERVLWAALFVISAATAVWLIKGLWLKYLESPVIVTFQPSEVFIGEVPFPAVTICNMNRVLKSKAETYMSIANNSDDEDEQVHEARQDVYYLDHVCSVSNKPFSKMFNYSMNRGVVDPELLAKVHISKDDESVQDVRQFLQKAAQPCEEMIQLCMFEGGVINCKNEFRPIETDYGMCCVFNMVPQTLIRFMADVRDTDEVLKLWKDKSDYENPFRPRSRYGIPNDKLNGKYPLHQHRAGKVSGLMFLADPALNEYFCTNSDSEGFRLRIHYTTDVPHVSDFGLAIRPNYEHYISVKPDLINAEEDIRSYAIDKRNCYFPNEFPLKYYRSYSASNCLDECVANITYAKCDCVRYYMPRDDTQSICTPKDYVCAEDVRLSLYMSGIKNMCQQCLPSCTEVRYSTSSTVAPMQTLGIWEDESKNITAPWAKKNVSIIHVYFGEDSTYPKVRTQLYGIADLLASTGGILGLCMGFSVISFFELIYHFTVRPCSRREEKKFNETQRTSKLKTTIDAQPNGSRSSNEESSTSDARRVQMKPGDDGMYHLQKCGTPSPPTYEMCSNGDCYHHPMERPSNSVEEENSQL